MLNCVFGLLMEEIIMVTEYIHPTSKIAKLRTDKQYPEYKTLSSAEKKIVQNFVNVREKADNFKLKLIHLESSVQLVFYLTLLVVNINEVPLLELNYKETKLEMASVKWIFGLIWFFLKTLLSGATTFAPIFTMLKKDSYKSKGAAPNIRQYVCVTVEVILELIFSAGVTFLEWFSFRIKRESNYRNGFF